MVDDMRLIKDCVVCFALAYVSLSLHKQAGATCGGSLDGTETADIGEVPVAEVIGSEEFASSSILVQNFLQIICQNMNHL